MRQYNIVVKRAGAVVEIKTMAGENAGQVIDKVIKGNAAYCRASAGAFTYEARKA